ncbi:MAG: hypothetical protein SCK70_01255 [bacterium]|nr:hypothetical protein [bacterium]
MKMIFISYMQSNDDDIMHIFKDLKIRSYTKWPDVLDKFDMSRLRLGADIIGPGSNSVIMISLDNEKSTTLMSKIKDLNETIKIGKNKAFVLPLEDTLEC